ncbi:MAG: hypothetical protein NTX11_03595 [Candidatus Saccharibacteria bacterium]|nr:hypothetical protein [Candidatus Saccharibacteria bacterium]
MSKNTPTKNATGTQYLTVALLLAVLVLQFAILFKINNDNQAILKNQSIQGLRLLNLDTTKISPPN